MASLTKRRTSKYWVACFTDGDGRRLKRSTASVERREAQKIADRFEEAARRKRTAIQVERVLGQLHPENKSEDFSPQSVRVFLDSWLARMAPGTAPRTLARYRDAASRFLSCLESSAEADLAAETHYQVTRVSKEQPEPPGSTTEVRRARAASSGGWSVWE